MTYALGQAAGAGGRIQVGQLARTDPIMSASSLMASRLLVQMVRRPEPRRLDWLRAELNKAQPGLGTRVVSKIRELMRRGRAPNQAVFDGMRLTLANFFADKFAQMQRRMGRGGVSGLGESVGDIRATSCLIMGTIGAGGATATALMSNPSGSTAVGEAAAGVMGANSCNAESIRAQADLTRAQAELAAASAGGASIVASADTPTMMYVGLGLGAAVLLLGGAFVLKKK